MSKLNIDQKNVMALFSDKKADFLIPDYQRPYAWTKKECQTLWDDLFLFAFPDNDCNKFSTSNEYFLGPIVTFKNEENKLEIIDGQQRLTTLMLLLRAFYERYGNMKSETAKKAVHQIEQCVWKTDEFGDPDKSQLKITSEVATDNDKEEFLSILKDGNAEGKKSSYAANYLFFQGKIKEFTDDYPDYFSYFPVRILNNCILPPIEAESQDTALRIFSTLNNRGKQLSDADIFKAQFYKYYSNQGRKDDFINKWKNLEILCNDIFHPLQGTPMDEIFSRYMYFVRAKQGIKTSTTEALRTFYERDSYALLKREDTLENMIDLAGFWRDVLSQDDERFTDKILRRLYILNYAPNSMWTYFLSVYYLENRDNEGMLDEDKLYQFLNRIIGFIWAYAITNPGVNALRTPVYAEMINIVNHVDVEFKDFLFEEEKMKSAILNHSFTNNRAITKSMLTWWAYQNEHQELLSFDSAFEIEHIFAKNRQDKEKSLKNPDNIESLGNKALLEKRINIRASDYRFCDKTKYYCGFEDAKGKKKEATKVQELLELAKQDDFVEADIEERLSRIIAGFILYLNDNGLLKSNS